MNGPNAFHELFRLWHGWMIENGWRDGAISLGDGRFLSVTTTSVVPTILEAKFDLGCGPRGVRRSDGVDSDGVDNFDWIGPPMRETDLIEIALLL